MRQLTTLTVGAALLLCGTFALASNVRTDYDHGANFSNYHTYSWGGVQSSNPLNESRIKTAVDRDLQAKGWQFVASGGSVTLFARDNVKNEQETENMYTGVGGGWGGGWGWRGFGGFGRGFGPSGFIEETTSVENQRVAHLVVDVFDATTHQLVFRGVADNDLSKKADKNAKTLDKDINDMFKKFPPKS